MRTKITEHSYSQVIIEFDESSMGLRMSLYIFANPNGGYVYYGKGYQLCEKLSCSGNTLHWSDDYPLVDLIRREYKAMRRKEMRKELVMKFDPSKHDPDPAYLRSLIERSGMSQQETARVLGISPRLLRQYIAFPPARSALECPYIVQFALENLVPNSGITIRAKLTDSTT